MIIREANKKDIDNGLLEVYIEGYRYHQKGRPDAFLNITDEELKKDLIDQFDTNSIVVIEDNNKIVGLLIYSFKGKHIPKLYIHQLVILEELRGKGLGKLLIEEAKRIAEKNKCNRIELDCWLFNKNAIDMYEHIGFDRQRIIYELILK